MIPGSDIQTNNVSAGRQVDRQVGSSAGRQVDRQVGSQVGSQVAGQLGSWVARQVGLFRRHANIQKSLFTQLYSYRITKTILKTSNSDSTKKLHSFISIVVPLWTHIKQRQYPDDRQTTGYRREVIGIAYWNSHTCGSIVSIVL